LTIRVFSPVVKKPQGLCHTMGARLTVEESSRRIYEGSSSQL
jgi:hypothetical protein